MVLNTEVTQERALAYARGCLHDNAAALYSQWPIGSVDDRKSFPALRGRSEDLLLEV